MPTAHDLSMLTGDELPEEFDDEFDDEFDEEEEEA